MSKVTIYNLMNSGEQSILATCELVNDRVICNGESAFIDKLSRTGIINYENAKSSRLYPGDGLLFLRQLKNNFKSGYITTSELTE